MAKKSKQKKPPPSAALRAINAAKAEAAKFAKKSVNEIAGNTYEAYHSVVESAIAQGRAASENIGTIVAEEAAWMELSPKEREARIAKKAAQILQRPPAQLPASVQPTTTDEARRQATRILKREAARQLQMSPKEHAKLAKELLGLYRGQAHAALEYRAQLIRSGMSPGDVDRAFKKLVAEKLEARAQTIAEYESRKARFELQRGRWREQMKSGNLSPTATKYVHVSGEACAICQRQKASNPTPGTEDWDKAGNSDPIPIFTKTGELRQYQIGNRVRRGKVWGRRWVKGPPFHPHCRCYEALSG